MLETFTLFIVLGLFGVLAGVGVAAVYGLLPWSLTIALCIGCAVFFYFSTNQAPVTPAQEKASRDLRFVEIDIYEGVKAEKHVRETAEKMRPVFPPSDEEMAKIESRLASLKSYNAELKGKADALRLIVDGKVEGKPSNASK